VSPWLTGDQRNKAGEAWNIRARQKDMKRRGRRIHGGCIAAALVLALAASRASARPGDLDPNFGDHGRVTTAAELNEPWLGRTGFGIAEAPRGTLAVASDRTLVRYLPDGRLDPRFGDGGIVKIAVTEGLRFSLSDIAVDREGRVVLFGRAVDASTPLQPVFPAYPAGFLFPSLAAILRYQRNGQLDPSFGDDGIVLTDFGLPPAPPYKTPVVAGTVGTVDSQDRPILIGGVEEEVGSCGHGVFGLLDRLIARLKPNGKLDPSFGEGDGISFLPNRNERVSDITLDRHGGPILAAAPREECGENPHLAVVRMHAHGTLDRSFGTNGMRIYAERVIPPGTLALDRFERILVMAGGLLRLTPGGNLDKSFGQQGGEATFPIPGNGQSEVDLAAVDSRGRPLLAGTLLEGSGEGHDDGFIMIRLRTSGEPDRSFGHGGFAITRFGRHSTASARGALIDRKGRLVVAGMVMRPSFEPTGGFALARYTLKG
jgi:uncharacterized delta-60 repeat protein